MKTIPESKTEIQLVEVNGEPLVDSRIIAQGLGSLHKYTLALIRKYQEGFEEFGKVLFKKAPSTSGQKETFTLLNEDQAIFLLTLSRNSPRVVVLKKGLTKTFGRYRREILRLARQAERRAQVEWQAARTNGKIARREETDAIKEFVEYARQQGSENAFRYFMVITKMLNQVLFPKEPGRSRPKDFRDQLDQPQLNALEMGERVVVRALREGMASGLPYREVFQIAKGRAVILADVVGMNITPLVGDAPANSAGVLSRVA
ncbi:MAG: Rha family transcriptional regulator [Magnetococcales bacterium]|nr:Rha family transcriptional regulator [Magnetococcales bacterium]